MTMAVPSEKNPMGLGIVGCGAITRQIHLPTLLALPDVRVEWLYDRDTGRGAALSAAAAVPALGDGEGERLPPVEGLLLAIPNGARPPFFDGLREGRAGMIYVEKPFARSIAEHEELAMGIEPWRIAVGHSYRSSATIRLLRDIVANGLFGKVWEIRFDFGGLGRILTGGGYMGDRRLSGGGVLYQMGSHYLDAAIFATGARSVTLDHGHMESEDGLDIHTDAVLDLELADGRHVPLKLLVTALRRASNRMIVTCDNAMLLLSPGNGVHPIDIQTTGGTPIARIEPTEEHGPLTPGATFARHWRRAIEAARTGQANETSVDSFLTTTRALEALYSLESA